MNISFPIEGFNVSGGIRIITNIANGLAKKGHAIRIIVPDYASKSHYPLAENIELIVVATGKCGWMKAIYYRLHLCVFSVRGSDLAFATGYKTPYYLLASKAMCISRVKLVYLVQGYEPWSHVRARVDIGAISKALLCTLAKFSYRLPIRKIAVSRWLKTMVGQDDVVVINNGIDRSIFCPAATGRQNHSGFVIGVIGSRSPGKGYSVFLEAIRILVKKGECGIRVHLATQSSLEMPLGITTVEIKPANDKEMADFYRGCNVFVFTSFVEGFGLPPLEAMACGVPVITTDCGGVSDFANDENSLRIPLGDAEALSTAILRLKSNRTLGASLSAHGLEVSKAYSIDAMIDGYCRLVDSI